jgi:hypothetical protein
MFEYQRGSHALTDQYLHAVLLRSELCGGLRRRKRCDEGEKQTVSGAEHVRERLRHLETLFQYFSWVLLGFNRFTNFTGL